jgi:hypothetical protein
LRLQVRGWEELGVDCQVDDRGGECDQDLGTGDPEITISSSDIADG